MTIRFTLIAIAILLFGSYVFKQVSLARGPNASLTGVTDLADWYGPEEYTGSWKPDFRNTTDYSIYTYSDKASGEKVILYIGYYQSQFQGGELINVSNRVYDMETWYPENDVVNKIELDSQMREVKEQLIKSQTNLKMLSWQTYLINGQFTSSNIHGKLLQLLGYFKNRYESFVVITGTNYFQDNPRDTLKRFSDKITGLNLYQLDE